MAAGEGCSTTEQFFRVRVSGAMQGERKMLERYDDDAKTVEQISRLWSPL